MSRRSQPRRGYANANARPACTLPRRKATGGFSFFTTKIRPSHPPLTRVMPNPPPICSTTVPGRMREATFIRQATTGQTANPPSAMALRPGPGTAKILRSAFQVSPTGPSRARCCTAEKLEHPRFSQQCAIVLCEGRVSSFTRLSQAHLHRGPFRTL